MLQNCWRSFVYTLGIVVILFLIASMIFSETIEIRHLYHMVAVAVPVYLFAFFTFELKLFSTRIRIRRSIVIAFGIIVMLVSGHAFGSLRPESRSLIIYALTALLCIAVSVFAYYVADKIEQRNLERINRKLDENNGNDAA